MTDQETMDLAIQLGRLDERMEAVRDGQDTIIARVGALPCPQHLERVTRIEERQEAQARSLARIEEAQLRAAKKIEEALKQRPSGTPAPAPRTRVQKWGPTAWATFLVGVIEGIRQLVGK